MSATTTTRALEVLRPGHEGYDAATRGFYNSARPGLVVRPRGPDEVAAALLRAAREDLQVSVRSGGHSPIDRGADTRDMMIDLAHRDGVEVLDPARRLVRVGGGATWGRVAAALDPLGWGISAGDTAGVGVGGLTLGGGVGWMVRRDGLAIDNLVSARVVTADGRVLTASASENPDLFWALRGGGGNFGVVVDLDFRAQPVGTVRFGTVTYRLDDPAGLLARWRDVMRSAPEELSSTLALLPPTPGRPPTAVLLLCHTGDDGTTPHRVDAAVEPLLGIGTVTGTSVSSCRYATVLEDAAPPAGVRLVVRNALVGCLDDAVIAAVCRVHAGRVPTALAVRSLGGAFGRVPGDATAFAHRDAEAMVVGLLTLPGATADPEIEQALVPWRDVAALGVGTYTNFQGSATTEDLAAAYPPRTYSRLAAIKHRYDPHNRFARNHNIPPAPGRCGR
jgi:FAD/FMN-containing dehydrogenase